MKEKLLVTGATGQLGTTLRKYLGDSVAIYAGHAQLDITDEQAVKTFVQKNQIGTIINCAAYTAVDQAETQPLLANAVNNLGAMYLAKYSKRIIHISTDYVFDGTGQFPYGPNDQANPISVYGKTKYLGEKAVIETAKTAVIIRTARLYSSVGRNFFSTMLRLGLEQSRLNVVADQIATPTYADDLALAIVKILPDIKQDVKTVYHFTNEGECSWYDFAVAIMEEAKINCQIEPIRSLQYKTKACRPAYSALSTDVIKKDFGLIVRHWRKALEDCINEMQMQKAETKRKDLC